MILPRDHRSLAAFLHDVLSAVVAWAAAFWLRLNLELPEPFFSAMMKAALWIVPLQALFCLVFGLYRGIWRYASIPDLIRIVLMACISSAIVAALVLGLGITNIPRSVLLIDPVLLVVLMGGSRLGYRIWKEGARGVLRPATRRKRALVLGAGDAASDLLRNLARGSEWRISGLLDDNPAKHGRQINGVTVLGPIDAVVTIAPKLGVEYAIIAMPGVNHVARRRALDLAARAGLKTMTVPAYEDIMSGKVTMSQLREVELDDLLGRDPVTLDDTGLEVWLAGKVVAITGAGGSIGSELCRQIARFGPAKLVLIESSEFALFTIVEEFSHRLPFQTIVPLIADIKNSARMSEIFTRYRPGAVFHAAAYKHVPLMEVENAWEAVQNNVVGTLACAQASCSASVEKFVLVSTDKAVNPTNVMGATKRLAELVCLASGTETTRFVTVRFGNVLGSTGSVIPTFREQIARGGPLKVTHPDIERYFMSITEAAQLVLQAGLMGTGNEIFVLDMGEPVRIVDLARDMIRLSGFTESDIRIEFSGLRPGEKLFEEPLSDSEHASNTLHPKLRIARASGALERERFEELLNWLSKPASRSVKMDLQRFVPEYQPSDQ